ncbi:hypothetical protein K435DRAFT_576560, partial [Dendrothele bispora CBS 962.96]
SEDDLAILRLFSFKLKSHITDDGFGLLPFVFPDNNVPSWKVTRKRVEELSNLRPEVYHCCVNSCMCYTGVYSEDTLCRFCKEPRFRPDGKPRKVFTYVPLIPRLIGYYRSLSMVEKLEYRATFTSDSGEITDVFDGSHYKSLCGQYVTVGGQPLDHKFFSDRRDIALGLSSDGFAPWRRRSKTC